MVTDRQTHTHPQTGPKTIHCTAKLSEQWKYSNTPLSKHASSCSAIRPNYQIQRQLLGFTYMYPRLRQPNECTLDENVGGHFYTVTHDDRKACWYD